MHIESFVFGPFATNCYVLCNEQNEAWIIDPACFSSQERQEMLTYIESKQLQVKAILATHGHLDHLWGAAWACKQWVLPVLIHPADIPMAQAMQQQYNLFGIRATPETFPIESLQSSIFDHHSSMSIISTPGHTDRKSVV